MLVVVRRAAPARVVAAHAALKVEARQKFQDARCSEQSQHCRSHHFLNGGEQMILQLKQISAIATAAIQLRTTRKNRMRSSRRVIARPGLSSPPSVRARRRRTRTMAQMKGRSQKRMKTVTNP